MTDISNIPRAAAPWKSYRYRGRYGFIFIGAMDDAEALTEAQRSEDGANDITKLERWNGCEYGAVQ